jgi:hypothetical protein
MLSPVEFDVLAGIDDVKAGRQASRWRKVELVSAVSANGNPGSQRGHTQAKPENEMRIEVNRFAYE